MWGMISEKDKAAILELALRYKATRVLLFGSCTEGKREPADIDIAVEGIPPQQFFRFYGDLIFAVSKPVDVIDLSQESAFTRLVRREGVSLHG
jgi:predicted nucleotidyltransferase